MTESEVDVLILGAGPSGVTLGLELAMQNISFRIIDKATERSDKSRALVVQPRTLELLNRQGHGLGTELSSLGQKNAGIRVHIDQKPILDIDINEKQFEDTAFPNPCFVSQAVTERLLDKELARYGKFVERGMIASGVEQDETHVTVNLTDANGKEETVRSKYLVGCDGAHSAVRHAAELEFKGEPYAQDFMLADMRLKFDGPHDRLLIYMAHTILVVFPLTNGMSRIAASRPGGGDSHADPTIEDFKALAKQMLPGEVELSDVTWMTRFRLHHRGVNNYRQGRIFVAGDAAHIHSPAGGQGMNTGMQDAINLGWKLATVLRGEKPDAFLDSYSEERHRVGQKLLETSDRLFTAGTNTNPIFLFLRSFFGPWIIPLLVTRKCAARALRFISQLNVRYRHSNIVATATLYHGPLQGGDRAPDGPLHGPSGTTSLHALMVGPTYHLVLFSGTGSKAATPEALKGAAAGFVAKIASPLKTHGIVTSAGKVGGEEAVDSDGVLHARYGFDEAGMVLVRPDGYIAFIGPLAAMEEMVAFATK